MKRFALICIPCIILMYGCSERTAEVQPVAEVSAGVPLIRFTIAGTGKIGTVDPHFAESKAEQTVSRALFEGLFIPDAETGRGVPALAERWEFSGGGRECTFYLRSSAWSDGLPVTARSFRDSWLRLLDPDTGSPFSRLPSAVIRGASEFHAGRTGREDVAIEAVDENILQVGFTKPFPPVEEIFSLPCFAPVPLHTLGDTEGSRTDGPFPYSRGTVCNGPYAVEEWSRNGGTVLRARGEYRVKSSNRIRQVVYRPVKTEEEGHALFEEGEADWLIDCRGRVEHIHPSLAVYFYLFQIPRFPVKNPEVRKALALSIDRDELLRQTAEAEGAPLFLPAYTLVPPMPGHESGAGTAHDPEEARRLMAEAGHPGGRGFPEIVLLTNEAPVHRIIAEGIRKQWRETLGVNVRLEVQKWERYLISRRAGAYHAARAGWRGDYQDPGQYLDMFVTGSELNDGRYSSALFDKLVSRAAEAPAGPERKRLYAEAEEVLLMQDRVCIPLFYYASVHVIDTGIWGGWHANVMDAHPLRDIYLK